MLCLQWVATVSDKPVLAILQLLVPYHKLLTFLSHAMNTFNHVIHVNYGNSSCPLPYNEYTLSVVMATVHALHANYGKIPCARSQMAAFMLSVYGMLCQPLWHFKCIAVCTSDS